MKDLEGMRTEQLHAERSRLLQGAQGAKDAFALMLISGAVKAVEREIEKRHHAAAAAGRI